MSFEPHDRKYEDVLVDDVFTFNHTFSREDIDAFSKISGDRNLLHLDRDFALRKGFNSEVVFGMLSASLFFFQGRQLCNRPRVTATPALCHPPPSHKR